MHHHFQRADALSREVIGACIEAHLALGPGLLESIYEKCLLRELELRRPSLDFLGFTFRYDRDLRGRDHRYLNVFPSATAISRAQANLRRLINKDRAFVSIPALIGQTNRWLQSWSRYFDHGDPRMPFRKLNNFVIRRLTRHLQRRSQRPYRPTGKRSTAI